MTTSWLICGAGGGLGSATARELARKGAARLLLAGLPEDRDRLEQDGRDLAVRFGTDVSVAAFDAAEGEGMQNLFEEAEGRLGPGYGLLWAVGVMEPQELLQADPDAARRHHEINYTAAMTAFESYAARAEEWGSGHLAAFGSPAGDRGRRSNYLYGADKAALHALLEGLRHRLARSTPKATVTTIKPGPTRTPMTAGMDKLPLLAEPEEQARRIVAGLAKRSAVIYTPPVWRLIMCAIRHLPRFVYNRLDL